MGECILVNSPSMVDHFMKGLSPLYGKWQFVIGLQWRLRQLAQRRKRRQSPQLKQLHQHPQWKPSLPIPSLHLQLQHPRLQSWSRTNSLLKKRKSKRRRKSKYYLCRIHYWFSKLLEVILFTNFLYVNFIVCELNTFQASKIFNLLWVLFYHLFKCKMHKSIFNKQSSSTYQNSN